MATWRSGLAWASGAIVLAGALLSANAPTDPAVAAPVSATVAAAEPAIRVRMERAEAQARTAAERGQEMDRAARRATAEVEKTARRSAALAARIQQSEARVEAARGRIAMIAAQRSGLDRRLAARRQPLVRLTAALQTFTRRPLGLSVLKPGSLRETVYLRAILQTTVPQVRSRTSALRAEIDRGEALALRQRAALRALAEERRTLDERRGRLAALETRQRLLSRQRSGSAARENERALALAEEARDLEALIDRLDQAGSLRAELAALDGPVLRPARPDAARPAPAPRARSTSGRGLAPVDLRLPAAGRTIAGFGSAGPGGLRSQGITLETSDGAQVIAPAAGRVVFAGPYRGYARIVIIQHGAGWTSLVTGLARTDVEIGEELVAGAPLGVARVDRPEVTLELRRDGVPVNPLDYVGQAAG